MVSAYPYNNDTSVTDISFRVRVQSTSSCTPPTLTCDDDEYSYSGNNYSVSGDYLFRKKHETTKEHLIRQRAAFKLFYPKVTYTVKKTKKYFLAEHTEIIKRESKFKNINLNLII